MKKDVVCGKDVDEASAVRTTYGDRTYYFCSNRCERDFADNPIRYVDKSRSVGSTEGSPKVMPSGSVVHSHS